MPEDQSYKYVSFTCSDTLPTVVFCKIHWYRMSIFTKYEARSEISNVTWYATEDDLILARCFRRDQCPVSENWVATW